MRQLAELWGPELDYSAPTEIGDLARRVLEYKLRWPAEDPEPPTLLLLNPRTAQVVPRTVGSFLKWAIQEAPLRGLSRADDVILDCLENNLIYISREDVWAFCDKTGLDPPSWWPRPKTGARQLWRGTLPALIKEIKAIQQAEVDADRRPLSQAKLAERLKAPRPLVREVCRNLPEELRAKSGRPKNSAE